MAMSPVGCSLPRVIEGRAKGYDLASICPQPGPAIYPAAMAQRQLLPYKPLPLLSPNLPSPLATALSCPRPQGSKGCSHVPLRLKFYGSVFLQHASTTNPGCLLTESVHPVSPWDCRQVTALSGCHCGRGGSSFLWAQPEIGAPQTFRDFDEK